MGFLFYFLGTSFVSMLLTTLLMNGKPTEYFRKTMDVWTSDVVGGLSSYILTWTLFYGIVRV